MSCEDIAISLRSLGKCYGISPYRKTPTTLGEAVAHRLRHPFPRIAKEFVWALRDVTFDVASGEVVGLIGHNGAGKSTLLKILSGITEPTEGEAALYGRVGSLLEVGTGFHNELTGRENIYLNGALLGMSRRAISRQLDAIIAFADIQRYVDTPVKQYSSGMEMRLAFAVAAHLDSEIMILDEVLAVGDAAFQKKCLNKIKALAGSGRTILFVSHTMDSIAQFCDSVLLLERGSVSYRGEVSAGIGHYLKGVVTDTAQPLIAQAGSQSRPGSGAVRITSVRPLKAAFMCNETKILEYNIKQLKPLSNKFFIACYLRDSHGVTIVNCDSRQYGHWIAVTDQHTGHFILRTPWLQPGDYSVTMFLGTDEMLDYYDNACILRVSPQPSDLIPSHDLKLSGDLTTLDLKAMAEGVVLAEFSYATLTI